MALTDVTVKDVPLVSVRESAGDAAAAELFHALTVSFNRQTDWIVSLGRRSASGRIGALFCEIHMRLAQNGPVKHPCTIPLTQQDIADVVGLTPVHVNRVLSDMRRRGLVQFSGKALIVPGLEELANLG